MESYSALSAVIGFSPSARNTVSVNFLVDRGGFRSSRVVHKGDKQNPYFVHKTPSNPRASDEEMKLSVRELRSDMRLTVELSAARADV